MLIVCPSCASRYSIDDDKIGASGRTVRCASCRTDFFVSLATETPEVPVAPAIAETPASPSTDDALAAQWLAEMEDEGNPVPDAEPEDENAQPQDLDQGSLDELFEAEMAAAQQEADNVTEAGRQADPAALPAVGWRRFLPGRRSKTERSKAERSKAAAPGAERTAAKPLARAAPRRGRPAHPGQASRLAKFKAPIALGLAGIIALAGAVTQRRSIVAVLPASASLFSAIKLPVNLTGLEFADVRSSSQTEGEARFLTVEGSVRSVSGEAVAVPLIEVRLRGEDGRTLYTWTAEPPRKSLKSGEALHFRTRLATPPEAGRDVEVRFTDKLQSAKAGS
jgi:predicted Zn finger-like uncharacterized protein